MDHVIRHLNILDVIGTHKVGIYIKDQNIQKILSNNVLSKSFTHNNNEQMFSILLDSINDKKMELTRNIVDILYYYDHEINRCKLIEHIDIFQVNMCEFNHMDQLYDDYVQLLNTNDLIKRLK
jgi:hypothetical protein